MASRPSFSDDGSVRLDHGGTIIVGRFRRPLAGQNLSQRSVLERRLGVRGGCGWFLGSVEEDEQRVSASIALSVTAFGIFGIALGGAYLAALRFNVRLYCNGVSLWKTLLVHLLRIVAVGAAFTACARHGVLPLLSGFGGFVTMRTASLRRCDLWFKPNIPTGKGGVART